MRGKIIGEHLFRILEEQNIKIEASEKSSTLNAPNGFSFISPTAIDFSISVFNCSTELIHISALPSSVLQIGIGIPQKRERDKFQSTKFSNQFPKRPLPVDFGFQLMVLLSSTILAL